VSTGKLSGQHCRHHGCCRWLQGRYATCLRHGLLNDYWMAYRSLEYRSPLPVKVVVVHPVSQQLVQHISSTALYSTGPEVDGPQWLLVSEIPCAQGSIMLGLRGLITTLAAATT
jgi:hypothetical protein